ncbi:hypothetical protein D3C72_1108360 [compost metagenome]
MEPTLGSLSTNSSPPIRCTSWRVMESPSPAPCLLTSGLICTRGSKMCSRWSLAMPMPVSVTLMRRKLPSTRALSTTLPWGVYLMALPTRL